MIDAYAKRIADTPAAREALRVIINRAIDDIAPDQLPPEVADACAVLDRESGLGSGGEGSEPGSDRETFDPESVYAAVQEEEGVSFGDFGLGGLLALPRTLSFWKMKARAQRFGEGGGHDLLKALMQAAGPDVRFHLMGHSFGCIVASAMTAGPAKLGTSARPVDTLILIQGALSLWSYAPEIPSAPGHPGYFHPILRGGRVRGAIVTTQSEHDAAVGKWYPLAAGVRRQVDYNDALPKYGAVGSFGLCGLDDRAEFGALQAASETYAFEPGRIYNLESSGDHPRGPGDVRRSPQRLRPPRSGSRRLVGHPGGDQFPLSGHSGRANDAHSMGQMPCDRRSLSLRTRSRGPSSVGRSSDENRSKSDRARWLAASKSWEAIIVVSR